MLFRSGRGIVASLVAIAESGGENISLAVPKKNSPEEIPRAVIDNATECKAGRQASKVRGGTSSFIDNNFLAVRITSHGYSVMGAALASLRRVLPISNTPAGAS